MAPAYLASYDNQPPPSTPGQLPGTSKGVCVCLNIIAPSILIKLCVFYYNFNKKSNPIIEYIRKMQYKLKCQAFFYVKYIPSYPCEN